KPGGFELNDAAGEGFGACACAPTWQAHATPRARGHGSQRMASRRDRRIEPSFEGPAKAASSAGFSVSEEDRVVPGNRQPSRKRKPAKAKSARGGRRKARRGLFGLSLRLLYWCLVLAIWGGIAAAGIVVY